MNKLNPKDYPYLAAGIQSVQYAHAGYVYLSWVGLATAGLLGVLVSFATALAASRINDIAKVRKSSAWVMLILLLLISPVFVGVGMWIALDIIPVPFWRVCVAALWGLIPDGSVALVGFIAGKGMTASEVKPAQVTETPRKKKTTKRQPITDKQLNNYWLNNPKATNVEVAQHFGVTPQAISKRKSKLYKVVN